MKYILALVGESGCGKDTIQKHVVGRHPEIQPIVRLSNRPMREGESQSNPYVFVTLKAFQQLAYKETDKFLEVERIVANDWFYGTHTELSFPECDSNIYIGSYSAESIEDLYTGCNYNKDDFTLIVIKIEVDDKIRLNRQLMRETNPDCYEICRRFISDKKDYDEELSMTHFMLDNSGDLNDSLEAIDAIIDSEIIGVN